MDVHFTDILRLLKNGQKLDSFADHFKQHFTFKLVKQLKPIGSMKTFTKPNLNLCLEEPLAILKNLRGKHFTVTNKNLDIYMDCQHKTTFR